MTRLRVWALVAAWGSLGLVSPALAEEKIRVACVGDSITFGAGVEQRDKNNYPAVLGRLLGDKYEVRNFGVSGATLLKKGDKPYWKLQQFQEASDWKPNLVVIKLGTNDTKPQNWKHESEFDDDLRAMSDHFTALASKPAVFLCKPAPVHKDNFGIREEILTQGVIPYVEQVAKEKHNRVIDLYAPLKGHKELLPDGVHPNAAGAAILATTVQAALLAPVPSVNPSRVIGN